MLKRTTLIAVLTASVAVTWAAVGASQEQDGCRTEVLKNPKRVVYRCSNGLSIEAESWAALETILPDAKAAPKSVSIRNRAVLIDLPKGNGPFQVRTPHAIASVRGTTYVVDATANSTSVFVVSGKVRVASTSGGQYGGDKVSLGAGEGVVVSRSARLEVKKWPKVKVAALLGRFSR